MSLCDLINNLDRTKYAPIVAFIFNVPSVIGYLRSQGINALYWPGISIFPHTTGGWYSTKSPFGIAGLVRTICLFRSSVKSTEKLIEFTRPDVVHLNSLVLAPSAIGAKRTKRKLVWHIRESVYPGSFGIRRKCLGSLVRRYADEAIFITENDRQQLTGSQKGMVIYELVDFTRFDRHIDGKVVRRELGISAEAKVVLFLGGKSFLKGSHIMLASALLIKSSVSEMELIVVGAVKSKSDGILARTARMFLPLMGSGTESQQFDTQIRKGNMLGYVHLLPFRHDPEKLMSAADVIVVPHTLPHFALPVAEAGAMAKPVVASRIGSLDEAVVDGDTGLLVTPNDPVELANAITCVLINPALAKQLGENGYRNSMEKFNVQKNVQAIMNIYNRICGFKE